MSHDPASGWIDRRVRSAMRGEMEGLRQAVAALAADLTTSRSEDQAEIASGRAEIARLQASLAEMDGMVSGLLEEAQDRAARTEAELQSLRGAIAERDATFQRDMHELREAITEARVAAEGNVEALREIVVEREAAAERESGAGRDALAERDARIEAVRVRLEGLLTQHRWDVEQLRESLAIVAERLPFND